MIDTAKSQDAGSESRAAPKIEPEKTHVTLEYAHNRPLTACLWDPLGRYIFFGAEDNGLHRFELKSQQVTSFGVHDSWVRAIGSTPDGRMILSGGYDGRLIWWPAAEDQPEPIRIVEGHQGWIRALDVSPDGRWVATCGNDHRVRLWETETGRLGCTFEGHDHHVYNVAFDPGGNTLVSCDLHGFVHFWDLPQDSALADGVHAVTPSRSLPRIEQLHQYDTTFRADIGGARCIGFASDGSSLALGGITNVTNAFAGVGEAVIVLIDLRTLNDIGEPSGREETGGDAEQSAIVALHTKDKLRGTTWGLAHHPEGFWIGVAGGGGGGWLYFWRGEEKEESFKLKLKNDGRGMSLSPDRSQVAIAHADRHLRIYTLSADPTDVET